MDMTLAVSAVALAVLTVGWLLRSLGKTLQRVVETLEIAASTTLEVARNGKGTDPELLERLESTERRVEEVAGDLTRYYRKIAQERRRIEDARADADLDPEDALDQLREGLRGGGGAPSGGGSGRRRRLKRRG